MTSLTNTELQAAIDSTIDSETGSVGNEHCITLLAEQIRRLNDTEGGGVITDNGDGMVDISAGIGVVGGVVVACSYQGGTPYKSEVNEFNMSLDTAKSLASSRGDDALTYGVYQRQGAIWRLVTDPKGVLPETVEGIN